MVISLTVVFVKDRLYNGAIRIGTTLSVDLLDKLVALRFDGKVEVLRCWNKAILA